MTGHSGIWLLELKKFHAQHINSEQERWFQFFKDGKTLNDEELPELMGTEEMRQAMNTLCQFSEKEKNYFAYQARQDYVRQQNSIRFDYEMALEAATQREQAERAEKETELLEKEAAILEKEAALAEVEKLKAQLKNQ